MCDFCNIPLLGPVSKEFNCPFWQHCQETELQSLKEIIDISSLNIKLNILMCEKKWTEEVFTCFWTLKQSLCAEINAPSLCVMIWLLLVILPAFCVILNASAFDIGEVEETNHCKGLFKQTTLGLKWRRWWQGKAYCNPDNTQCSIKLSANLPHW